MESGTGCFVGQEPSEWGSVAPSASQYSATGGALCISANRISFVFGLKGPSVVIDTACSGSLVSLDSGRRSLFTDGCERFLVGGVQLQLAPWSFVGLS
jgi:acyl transferase domain-containing protein